MSLKHFRWNKVFPPLNKEKVKKSVGKSVKETGIEIVIVLVIILGIWIYRWYQSTTPEQLTEQITGSSVTSTAETDSSESSFVPGSTTIVSITDPIDNPAEIVSVTVPLNVYEAALAIDVDSLGPDDYAVSLNGGEPFFLEEEGFIIPDPTYPENCIFEYYSPLDDLGRCGPALACLSTALMPPSDVERGDISSVYPSGWNQLSAPDVNGGYLYNRSHLIAWCLAGENDNVSNLITGTRQFNVDGMYDAAEGAVLGYLQTYPGNHVMYRVTPVFVDNELVARGVVIEAWSIEDNGGLSFCYFIPNVQAGYTIDYATGIATAN